LRKSGRKKDIRVGVVGYGGKFSMGRKHLEQIAAAGMTPAAVAEVVPERLAAAGREFPGIETYPSLGHMLRGSDVQLVVVVTPHNTHAPLALQALRAGRHVVVEKPMAVSTAECDAMIRAARRRRLMVTTYHNRHWDGCILNAVRTVRSGAIGRVVRIAVDWGGWGHPGDWWRSSRRISGGVLYDWGVHLLEYAMQLIDSRVTEVSGFASTGFWAKKTRWKSGTNEDEAFAVIRFAGGQWLRLGVGNLDSTPRTHRFEVTGTKGSYRFNHREWELYTHDGDRLVRTSGSNPEGQGRRFYRNVADHLARGKKLVITPEWGRRMIHLLDLAGRSARAGKALKPRYT
jgi:predicted dehydrogenase